MRIVGIDFETKGIEARPAYPPAPVGVAIMDYDRISGQRSMKGAGRYLAWGHPTGNNCTKAEAQKILRDLWRDDDVVLVFHNAKFDLEVARVHLALALPGWRRIHDTMILAYLDDPRAPSLGVKELAHALLREKPEERDAVRQWLIDNGVVRKTQKDWGAHIWEAPPSVVGPYAIGDVRKSLRLLKKLLDDIKKRKMEQAYDRERRIIALILDNEDRGVRVALERLRRDVKAYTTVLNDIDAWLVKRLKAPATINFDSDEEVADALDAAGVVKEWVLTAGGKRSTSMKKMTILDIDVRGMITYRGKLATSLRTFMMPWLEQAEKTGGKIHTNWNQTRGTNDKGTRTGRLSSNPNFQNIPKEFPKIQLPLKLPPLPDVRGYIIADEDHVIISLDYSQQELRALGHFEDGPLLEAYTKNPRMDLHEHARVLINAMLGTKLDRKPIKNMGFGLIYGMGINLLAEQMGVDVETAKRIKAAYLKIFPGLRSLDFDLKRRCALNQPIRTWGGREYYVEPPRVIDGVLRTFEYKMLNYLIQGSSADCTKEAMARYAEAAPRSRFLAQVHDQILISAPRKTWRAELDVLRKAMESVEFDVPMLTDASVGDSWATLEEVK